MTTFIEELDKLLAHAQEFKAGHLGKVRNDVLNLVSERIIGDKEYYHEHYPFVRTQNQHIEAKEKSARDELRVDQRTTLYEGTKVKITE